MSFPRERADALRSRPVRTLAPPPDSVVDPATGEPRYGSFAGPLPPVDLAPLGRGGLDLLLRRKRWMYVAIASEDLLAGMAVVDLGYTLNAFGFVHERGASELEADCSALGLPGSGGVNDTTGRGFAARFRSGRTTVTLSRHREERLDVDARFEGFSVDARVSLSGERSPLSAVGPVPGGVIDATEKRALLPVEGTLRIGRTSYSLDGAIAGFDYTQGILARHTEWRWAFLMGRTTDGVPVALNLVEGFLGERECAAWIGDELLPLAEGTFAFDRRRPERPWKVGSKDGAVDLVFEPGGIHSERRNLGIVRSRFLHPVGAYSGTVRAGDRTVQLAGVQGVAEDQDVVW